MSVEVWVVLIVVAAVFILPRLLRGRKVPASLVAEKIRSGAVILDVRSPEEFRSGAYPGALNIPLGALAARLSELPKGKPVVVYCASGVRSASAARVLGAAGFADVLNAGGLGSMPR